MIKKQIVLSVVVASVFFIGCGDKTTESTKNETIKVETKAETKKVAIVKVETKKEVVKKEIMKKEVLKVVDTGASLYMKCKSCHGANAQNKALGKSEIIKNWDASKIEKALKGYQSGTYGGAMKGVMIGQVKGMTENQIKLISQHISSF